MTISSMKKSLGMDKLETDFETYKKDTSVKIKSLEDEKLKIKIEKNTLQVMELSDFKFACNCNSR